MSDDDIELIHSPLTRTHSAYEAFVAKQKPVFQGN